MISTAEQAFKRPYGAVKVLLGMQCRSVHCEDGRQAQDVLFQKSVFHTGWVLTGCTPLPHGGKGSDSKKATAIESQNSPSSGEDRAKGQEGCVTHRGPSRPCSNSL